MGVRVPLPPRRQQRRPQRRLARVRHRPAALLRRRRHLREGAGPPHILPSAARPSALGAVARRRCGRVRVSGRCPRCLYPRFPPSNSRPGDPSTPAPPQLAGGLRLRATVFRARDRGKSTFEDAFNLAEELSQPGGRTKEAEAQIPAHGAPSREREGWALEARLELDTPRRSLPPARGAPPGRQRDPPRCAHPQPPRPEGDDVEAGVPRGARRRQGEGGLQAGGVRGIRARPFPPVLTSTRADRKSVV